MNEDRNQDRHVMQQARQKHPDEWQRDLNPNHLSGQNIGQESDARAASDSTAFHLRRRGAELNGLDDNELKQVPVLNEGTRLQQGATYVDLAGNACEEFTATGDMSAGPQNAYVAKDQVPYEIWNRLIGEPKPGQERPSGDEGPKKNPPSR
jgi:hypothetical protein